MSIATEDHDWWLISSGYRDDPHGYVTRVEHEEIKAWDGFDPLFVTDKRGTQLREWLQQRGVALTRLLWDDKDDGDHPYDRQEIWLLEMTPALVREVLGTFDR